MISNKLFGTDGIRGDVSSIHLLPENMAKLGGILGGLVKNPSSNKPCITIGRDTRASSLYIEHALISGISAVGVDCQLVGVLPTAAVAFYTKRSRSALGLVISASHNPSHDNGIKLFDYHGFKVSEAFECIVEERYFMHTHARDNQLSRLPGKIMHQESADKEYSAMIQSAFGRYPSFKGLTVVVDCAHGAASRIAGRIFADLGLTVHIIGASPDGNNINHDFGSESPENLKSEVKKHKADLGIAFDGDADRVIFVDEHGEMIDGDAILATMSIDFKKSGKLSKNVVVATIMSNIALDKSLAEHDINVVRTPVGDKFVAHAMHANGYSVGGENSGHLIIFPQATTGDGIFSALSFIDLLHRSSRSASELVSFFHPMPKVLKNIEVRVKIPLAQLPKTEAAIAKANDELRAVGRVMMRYSGTENKIRLLVEATSKNECQKIAHEITDEFNREIGAIT